LSDAITCAQRTVVEPGLYDAITCAQRTVVEPGLYDAITCAQRTVVVPGLYDAQLLCNLPPSLAKKKEDMLNERKRRNLPNSFDIL
jgi:hypothetical protein